MKKWLQTIAQVAVIAGGVMGVPASLPSEQQGTAKDVATVAGIVAALILKSPREKGKKK